jgi:hypothetical protein
MRLVDETAAPEVEAGTVEAPATGAALTMSFGQPYLLLLLLGLPVLAWLKGRRHHPPAFVYSSVQLVRGITGVRRSHAGVILLRLRWLSLALFIVALAQPRVGEGETRITASGVDIVVAVDRSSSMSAIDFKLNGQEVDRLLIAKDVVRRFVEKRPNDRIGLITFALNAYMASPLTLDHDFLKQNLERLEIAERGRGWDGDRLGAGVGVEPVARGAVGEQDRDPDDRWPEQRGEGATVDGGGGGGGVGGEGVHDRGGNPRSGARAVH